MVWIQSLNDNLVNFESLFEVVKNKGKVKLRSGNIVELRGWQIITFDSNTVIPYIKGYYADDKSFFGHWFCNGKYVQTSGESLIRIIEHIFDIVEILE